MIVAQSVHVPFRIYNSRADCTRRATNTLSYHHDVILISSGNSNWHRQRKCSSRVSRNANCLRRGLFFTCSQRVNRAGHFNLNGKTLEVRANLHDRF